MAQLLRVKILLDLRKSQHTILRNPELYIGRWYSNVAGLTHQALQDLDHLGLSRSGFHDRRFPDAERWPLTARPDASDKMTGY
jgi:hypothetical protein